MAECILPWALNFNFNSDNEEWNFNVYSVENPNPWNTDNHFLVGYYVLSSVMGERP